MLSDLGSVATTAATEIGHGHSFFSVATGSTKIIILTFFILVSVPFTHELLIDLKPKNKDTKL